MLRQNIIAGAIWVLLVAGSSLLSLAASDIDQHVCHDETGSCSVADSNETDFLIKDKSAKTIKGFGRLQNTSHSLDSVDKIGSISVYDEHQTYEIVCVYGSVEVRSRLSQDSAARLFLNSDDWMSDWRVYHCFGFVYRMRDPDYLADTEHEVEFPTKVAAYERVGPTKWLHLGTTYVVSYSELAELMFRSIYKEKDR